MNCPAVIGCHPQKLSGMSNQICIICTVYTMCTYHPSDHWRLSSKIWNHYLDFTCFSTIDGSNRIVVDYPPAIENNHGTTAITIITTIIHRDKYIICVCNLSDTYQSLQIHKKSARHRRHHVPRCKAGHLPGVPNQEAAAPYLLGMTHGINVENNVLYI